MLILMFKPLKQESRMIRLQLKQKMLNQLLLSKRPLRKHQLMVPLLKLLRLVHKLMQPVVSNRYLQSKWLKFRLKLKHKPTLKLNNLPQRHLLQRKLLLKLLRKLLRKKLPLKRNQLLRKHLRSKNQQPKLQLKPHQLMELLLKLMSNLD